MSFVSVRRIVGVTSGVIRKIGLVRNIGTISSCRNSRDDFGVTTCFEVRSVLGQCLLVDCVAKREYCQSVGVQQKIPPPPMKKRPLRKKRVISDDEELPQPGFWNVKALATAEEYDLENLLEGLLEQDLYTPRKINTSSKCKFFT